ncbi:MAG: hypothetical protein AAF630_09825 [Cyanobacteria bacterium P01_C01_bin.38]
MSTTPKSNYQSKGNKILVSLNLNVPIQFEIELETTESQKINQLNQLNNQELSSVISANSDIVINEINKAKLDEKIKDVLYNLEDDSFQNHREEQSRNMMTQDIPNTSLINANEPQSNQQNVNTVNQRKVRLADSFNNSLTLTVNFLATMLRLGKLANYSWE